MPESQPGNPSGEPDTHNSPAVERSERLAECEHKLAEIFRESFTRVGEVLRKIRDEKLYEGSHDRFVDYLEDRWGKTINYANRLINAAVFCEQISRMPIGTVAMPTTESQVRPLFRLKDLKSQAAAWEKAVESAGGQVPTAEQVDGIVKSLVTPKSVGRVDRKTKPVKAEGIVGEEGNYEGEEPKPSPQKQAEAGPAPTPESKMAEPELEAGSAFNERDAPQDPLNDARKAEELSILPTEDDSTEHPVPQHGEDAGEITPTGTGTAVEPHNKDLKENEESTEAALRSLSTPESEDVNNSPAKQDGTYVQEIEGRVDHLVSYVLADQSTATCLVDHQSQMVPTRLVNVTLQLIAGARTVSVEEVVRRQRAALGIAETLDRLSRAREVDNLETGLLAVENALKWWRTTLLTEQKRCKAKR